MENNVLEKKQKPPYLLGLLCLIPLVGAFVGLGLLLCGLIKYKDKWLSIIGVLGIVFTIVIYSFLFYITQSKTFFKDVNIEASQAYLNSLVKNVEFYKIQYGKYPDSLQQLSKEDKLVIIFDWLPQDKLGENRQLYNYKKMGDKYTLFSSGIDGIPNTKDDLYPQITTIDSSKIGLIKLK